MKDERAGEIRRDPLTANIARLTQQRFAVPNISGKDTVAEQVTAITAGRIDPRDVNVFRNVVPALMLMFSGALVALSRTLWRQQK